MGLCAHYCTEGEPFEPLCVGGEIKTSVLQCSSVRTAQKDVLLLVLIGLSPQQSSFRAVCISINIKTSRVSLLLSGTRCLARGLHERAQSLRENQFYLEC